MFPSSIETASLSEAARQSHATARMSTAAPRSTIRQLLSRRRQAHADRA
jgi:hypothetical protein